MPVFFGLYYMLRDQGQPGGQFAFPYPTVPWLWIQDITKFDIVLMFLYIGSQFVASWQTARKGVGQQKMIAYMMPIIVGIFMFIGKWPAGLFIYWFTSNVWTIAQQYVAERMMPMPVPAMASSAKEKAPAKAPAKTGAKTGTTPSKPKAPSAQSARKTGGKTSGQKTATKGQAAGGKSKRPNSGAGGSKSSG
jgi:YidC/Oxa1 family membrane protein insertase